MTTFRSSDASPATLVPGLENLAARHCELLTETPKLRRRNAAKHLGVSELELLLAGGDGATAQRLRPEFKDILGRAPTLGPILAVTRNETFVHEKTGSYNPPSFDGPVGLVLGDAIDLRIFLWHWAHAFAVQEKGPHGLRRSLQFFDKAGRALHKIFLTKTSDIAAFETLTAAFADPDAAPLMLESLTPEKPSLEDDQIDRPGFLAAWDALKDTHEFQGLLTRFKLMRQQALRLAGQQRARPVKADALRRILQDAVAAKTPIMVFVGNPGIIQIHTGPIKKLLASPPWFNILDPDFSLHVCEPEITHAWVVYKPTVDGVVTSLELFDAKEVLVASLFGKRKPGEAEDPAWRALVAALPTLGAQ